jgi:thiazole/oxazole-forming peptide maturase SagD family component
MKLASAELASGLPPATSRLVERMVSPLVGLDRMVGVIVRGRLEPRFMVAGAELTGVHLLAGQDKPGSYHIGGTGIFPHEALIRTLGESVERYAQMVSGAVGRPMRMASWHEMRSAGLAVPRTEQLEFFTAEQHETKGFRFDRFDPDAALAWVRAAALPGGGERWLPAQLVLVGYHPRRDRGEPWLIPAVTTGTAAHTNPLLALRGALLELIQIDAAMGHWYGPARAPEIILDERAAAIRAIGGEHFSPHRPPPRFHWIPSPDMPGLTVACVLEGPPGHAPAAAVGLGVDLCLPAALYKAMLEAVGVFQLAKVTLLQERIGAPEANAPIDADAIMDLDTNVAYYADPAHAPKLEEKFGGVPPVRASDLPGDVERDTLEEVRLLARAFRETGKDLSYLDLTTPEVAALGFVALRAWSPDLLGMPLPSAPALGNPRMRHYGGPGHQQPHPYP